MNASPKGLEPSRTSDATEDPDGDGDSNLIEYRAGTNPFNSVSVLRVGTISRGADEARMRFTTIRNRQYVLEKSTDLSEWTAGDPISGTGFPVTVSDVVGNAAQQFYRIRLVQ